MAPVKNASSSTSNLSASSSLPRQTALKLLLLYIPLLVVLILAKNQSQVPFSYLSRDPLTVAQAPFYYGCLSNLGILFWCSTTAISLFSFFVLREIRQFRQEWLSFLLATGVFTGVLLLDDLYLLHDAFFPKILGIPEKLVYLSYGILVVGYLVKFRKTILKTEFLPLAIALFWLTLSPVIDANWLPFLTLEKDENIVFLEDGVKLLGITSCFFYYTTLSVSLVKRAVEYNQVKS